MGRHSWEALRFFISTSVNGAKKSNWSLADAIVSEFGYQISGQWRSTISQTRPKATLHKYLGFLALIVQLGIEANPKMAIRHLTARICLALAVLLPVATLAAAEATYRPMDHRVVCVTEDATAKIRTRPAGDEKAALPNGRDVQIVDFKFGTDGNGYFSISYAGVDARQTGYVLASDVKTTCGFEARRRVTLNQYRAPDNTCHMIGASRRTVPEVNDFVRANMSFFPSMEVYQSDNGWFAISLGLVRVDAVGQVKRAGDTIPPDAYCSDGADYIAVLEKLGDSFRPLDIPAFDSLAGRFRAASATVIEGDRTKDSALYKLGCDLGNGVGCARYAAALNGKGRPDRAETIQRAHYDLLACMRGDQVGCNNAYQMPDPVIDTVLAVTLGSEPGDDNPTVADELARIACDADVLPSCRHLAETVLGAPASNYPEFRMAVHAVTKLCTSRTDEFCRSFKTFRREQDARLTPEDRTFFDFLYASGYGDRCRHDPAISYARCSESYDSYRRFLAANTGTGPMRQTAANFLIDGCEVRDYDACVAFDSIAHTLPEDDNGRDDILPNGGQAFLCNPGSEVTNLRNRPTTEGAYVMGRLANGQRVRIKDNILNDAGYLYLEVEVADEREGVVKARSGFVYGKAIARTCNLRHPPTEAITQLANRLVASNPSLMASDIVAFNADFDGTRLLLMDMPGLRDLSPLAGLERLEFLDLTDAGATDLSPLADIASLRTLSLYNTDVVDISPLSKLSNLNTLNLRGTGVEDFSPLGKLTGLEVLYLPSSSFDPGPTVQELAENGLAVQ